MSQLPDNLEPEIRKARQLLDGGAVNAARLLSGKIYHGAKQAAMAAKRVKASRDLILRAYDLQAAALTIEFQSQIRLADEYDIAQNAGKARQKGRPENVPGEDIFSAEEAGLDRRDIHRARLTRDAEKAEPGIIEKAIRARLESGLEPSKAEVNKAVRGIGTRSATKQERGDDFYETPECAVHALLAHEQFSDFIWEPACGKGAISRHLEAAGYDVALADLIDRGAVTRDGECATVGDFLETKRDKTQKRDIITNPPFNIANAFIAHALREHRPAKMAMLLNLNFICGYKDADRNFVMDECPPTRIYVFTKRLPMMHRDGWRGNESGSQMNTAWFVWEKANNGRYVKKPPVLYRVNWLDTIPDSGTDDGQGGAA